MVKARQMTKFGTKRIQAARALKTSQAPEQFKLPTSLDRSGLCARIVKLMLFRDNPI
jgi:hypothetical protein